MTATKTEPARHARATSIKRTASALAGVIFLTSFICLWRLQIAGLSRWYAFLSVPIAACSFVVMITIAGQGEHPGRRTQQAGTVLAIFTLTLLAVIRVLLPVSLGAGRKAIWAQPLIVTGGVAALFLAMNLIARLPAARVSPRERGRWLNWPKLGAFLLILGAVAYFSLPRRATVLPAQPRPANSLTVLLAMTVIALLVVSVTHPRRAVAANSTIVAVLLPAIVAAGFFGLTRDLGMAVAVLCASTAVLMTGTPKLLAAHAKGNSPKLRGWPEFTLGSFAMFAAAASLIIWFGSKLLGIPHFGATEALGYSDRQPAPFFVGENLIRGPGLDYWFTYLWHGRTSTAPEVLAMVGHEAGLPSLLGLIIVFALLFFSLARLAMQIRNRSDAALAWGLIVFLAAQCLLAVETLFPVGVPIGEGPPLLSGGWADYLADLIAIGIVIGLSRQASQPMPATMPAQTH